MFLVVFRNRKRADLDVFYMIDSIMPKETWIHESVIGTYLRVRF